MKELVIAICINENKIDVAGYDEENKKIKKFSFNNEKEFTEIFAPMSLNFDVSVLVEKNLNNREELVKIFDMLFPILVKKLFELQSETHNPINLLKTYAKSKEIELIFDEPRPTKKKKSKK